MRLSDLIRPHLDGVSRVLDRYGDAFDVEPWLVLPAHIKYERAEPAVTPLPGDLMVVGAAATGGGTGVPPELLAGVRLLLLSSEPAAAFCYDEVLDSLVAAGCQVRQVAPIDTRAVRTALVAERVESVQPPLDYLGRPVVGADTGALLRVVNEHALAGYVSRAVREQLRGCEDELQRWQSRGGGDQLRRRVDEAEKRSGELAVRLRRTEEELRQSRRRLGLVENSTSMAVGRALVGVAKAPRRAPRASAELLSRWRARSTRLGPPEPAPQDEGEQRRGFVTAARLAPSTPGRPAIAGVLRDNTAAALAPDCTLTLLAPHDADLLVEATAPDLLLIEAAAGRSGETWAYLGTPYAVDRERMLLTAIDNARAISCRVVFWWNRPYAEVPGLARLADLCDVVVAGYGGPADRAPWSRGVQLALHNPIGATNERPTPLTVGNGEREPGAWLRSAERYRRAAVVVPLGGVGAEFALRDELLEALACGARVVAPDAAGMPASLAAATVPDPVDARGAGRAGDARLRMLMRDMFLHWSTTARLARLAELAGVPSPAPGVTVVARPADTADVETLVADILVQRLRPSQVVLAYDGAAQRPCAELAAAGIPVHRLPSAADPEALLDRCTGHWVVIRRAAPTPRWPETHLLDLAVAAAVSGADAIGFTAGADFRYTTALTDGAAAVRRCSALRYGPAPDGDVDGWWGRGGRLFALAAGVSS